MKYEEKIGAIPLKNHQLRQIIIYKLTMNLRRTKHNKLIYSIFFDDLAHFMRLQGKSMIKNCIFFHLYEQLHKQEHMILKSSNKPTCVNYGYNNSVVRSAILSTVSIRAVLYCIAAFIQSYTQVSFFKVQLFNRQSVNSTSAQSSFIKFGFMRSLTYRIRTIQNFLIKIYGGFSLRFKAFIRPYIRADMSLSLFLGN